VPYLQSQLEVRRHPRPLIELKVDHQDLIPLCP
jgi:hypothetical protein